MLLWQRMQGRRIAHALLHHERPKTQPKSMHVTIRSAAVADFREASAAYVREEVIRGIDTVRALRS